MAFLITLGMIHFTCKSSLALSVLLQHLTSNYRSTKPLRQIQIFTKNQPEFEFDFETGDSFCKGEMVGVSHPDMAPSPL